MKPVDEKTNSEDNMGEKSGASKTDTNENQESSMTIMNPINYLMSKSRGFALIIVGLLIYLLANISTSGFEEPMKTILALVGPIAIGFGIIMVFLEYRTEGRQIKSELLPMESLGDLEQAFQQLGKNYDILRGQTIQGFAMSAVFMTLGLVVILIGATGQMFGLTVANANLSTIAGLITEFISASALIIYRLNFQRLNKVSDELNTTWRLLAAFKRSEALSEDRRGNILEDLIRALAKLETPKGSVTNVT
ncbi:MAG: hypothetical protein GC179_22905 [Anaerolineaceae bacterium]|nr:hypothetical protein [Anaerolineaceae bacterium]